MEEDVDPEVLDAALIAAAQKVEHYEIAGYGTVRTWASQLGYDDVAELLQETLDEEVDTDKKLTELATSIVNEDASDEDDEGEDDEGEDDEGEDDQGEDDQGEDDEGEVDGDAEAKEAEGESTPRRRSSSWRGEFVISKSCTACRASLRRAGPNAGLSRSLHADVPCQFPEWGLAMLLVSETEWVRAMSNDALEEVHRLRRRVEQLQQQVDRLQKALDAILERLNFVASSTQSLAQSKS